MSLPVVQEQPEARCTGHCCEHFTMPQSPERLWEMYEEWHKQQRGDRLLPYDNDIHMIAPMVIHLGEVTHDPIDGQPYLGGKVKHNYTCKHFDKTTRNCGIYEHRPKMCRDYPDGYTCRYEGCTAAPPPPVMLTPIDEEMQKKWEEVRGEVLAEETHDKMEAE